MKYLSPFPHPSLHPLARLRAWHRTLLAFAAGGIASAWPDVWESRLLLGWLAASTTYLILAWWGVGRLTAAQTRLRAKTYDPGSGAIALAVVAMAWVSLGGVLMAIDAARTMTGMARWGHIALSLLALATAWLMVQTVFALRYARLYYRSPRPDGAHAGGLRFPGRDDPDYADFAYYAAIIGMTSQVSDVQVETTAMRRLTLAHGLVSFAFNLLVLALAINVVAGALA
jgi:uncharacterized membrane protein